MCFATGTHGINPIEFTVAKIELVRLVRENGTEKDPLSNILCITDMTGESFYVLNHRVNLVDPKLIKARPML